MNSSTSKTVVVAISRPSSEDTLAEHAISITTPSDRIVFVAAVNAKEANNAEQQSRLAAAFAHTTELCARRNRQCEMRRVLFNSSPTTSARSERIDVADALCIAAQMNDASTLVLGFRGIGVASRTMFGSVSDHCSRTCPVSVAVVKSRHHVSSSSSSS
jgi:nucleotide-binding universal stress UspA family protein